MMQARTYQVGAVARIAGVSVRTLHHYESIGLLAPSARTSAGYRLYDDQDLLRLQQILIGRKLGLPLEGIRQLLDDPTADRRELLLQQRAQLLERVRVDQAVIRSIDAALSLLGESPSGASAIMDMKQIFDGFDPAEYQDEAHARWGQTDAYKESTRRAGQYSEADWRRFKAEWDEIMNDAAAALRANRNPDDLEVMAIAERHRLSIDRWFYPCSASMHAGLADMYEMDPRFAKNIDRYADSLTPFWSAAIRANAARLGGG